MCAIAIDIVFEKSLSINGRQQNTPLTIKTIIKYALS